MVPSLKVMFEIASAVPASTVTSPIAIPADILTLRDMRLTPFRLRFVTMRRTWADGIFASPWHRPSICGCHYEGHLAATVGQRSIETESRLSQGLVKP